MGFGESLLIRQEPRNHLKGVTLPATSSPGKAKGKRDFPRILCKLQSKDIKYYFVYGLNNYNFGNTHPDHVLEK